MAHSSPAMDMDAHRATYKGFVRGVQLVVLGCAALLIGLGYFLV